jgi:hypothetical protein
MIREHVFDQTDRWCKMLHGRIGGFVHQVRSKVWIGLWTAMCTREEVRRSIMMLRAVLISRSILSDIEHLDVRFFHRFDVVTSCSG